MQLPKNLYNQKVSCYLYTRGKTRMVSLLHKGRVGGHAGGVILENVRFRVQEGTRQSVIRKKRKTPHAFVDGVLMQCSEQQWKPESEEGIKVSYNPYKGGFFYDQATGEPIHSAKLAVVTPQGVLAFI